LSSLVVSLSKTIKAINEKITIIPVVINVLFIDNTFY
jgi:hypothetical protein